MYWAIHIRLSLNFKKNKPEKTFSPKAREPNKTYKLSKPK